MAVVALSSIAVDIYLARRAGSRNRTSGVEFRRFLASRVNSVIQVYGHGWESGSEALFHWEMADGIQIDGSDAIAALGVIDV